MRVDAPRVLIAATASGVGKTTIACGLLHALKRRGLRVQACKCGPDYLDPQFHQAVLGIPSRNLDLFMAGESLVCELVARGASEADLTVIEGVMGYYDGIAQSDVASTYDVARVTQTPTLLVVDARGRALSVAAEVGGFLRFREQSQVKGVILNRVSEGYASRLAPVVERETGVPVLGFLPPIEEGRLASRHLGLVAASEVSDLLGKVDAVASVLERTLDIDALVSLARSARPIAYEPQSLLGRVEGTPVIAVARDEAFSFYYEDSLALLERIGARLAFFSPLHDDALPRGACGLYLGGGYPELHARELSANTTMLAHIRSSIADGMPTIAECGGFLYLHESLEDASGVCWPMAGVVPARAWRGERLGRFGYVMLGAKGSSLLCDAGESMAAHEFHYWESDDPGDSFFAQKPQSSRGWDCVVSGPTLYAGFPHLYLAGNPKAAERFVRACAAHGSGQVWGEG